jgi:CubicO group peptidase (beta-lactamase class C family)
MSAKVSGTVASGFEAVSDAFAEGFAGHPTMGAGLHIRVDGKPVVNLWSGVADERSSGPWSAHTPSVIFSCTKGLVSLLAANLVREGRLAYDEPVATYWPEFAAAGKGTVTVAQLLSHQAGLSALRENLTRDDLLNWDRVTALLAAQEPLWPTGTGYAYHALTHGWLAGDVIRRIVGCSVGEYFNDLVARPLGVDAWIGLPGNLAGQPAHLQVSAALEDLWRDEARKPEPNWSFKAMTLGEALPAALVTPDGGFNDPAIRGAEIPGAGGIASAEALATIWSATVATTNGIRLLDDEVLDAATQTQSQGRPIFEADPPYSRWGMGFQLDSDARRYLGDTSFGHDGAGGQVGFADRRTRIGFGYVTNWMMGPGDVRATRIIDALRAIVS